MDGIPYSIWRDLPHPDGPNLCGRGLVPFTDFEVTLARQILSCSLYMQHIQRVDPALLLRAGNPAWLDGQRVVPHPVPKGYVVPVRNAEGSAVSWNTYALSKAAVRVTFAESSVTDDASTDDSECELDGVQNPSLFSHRSTVQDLIAAFHRNAIGPLGGVHVREELRPDGSPQVLILSGDPSADTPDCPRNKWKIEQEERELEKRWRATKRVAENWLTRVGPARERVRMREEKLEKDRERMKHSAMGQLMTKGDASPQGIATWPQSHPLVQQSQSRSRGQQPAASQVAPVPTCAHGPLHPRAPLSSTGPPPTIVPTAPCRPRPAPPPPARPPVIYDPQTPFFEEIPLDELIIYIPPEWDEPPRLTFSDRTSDFAHQMGFGGLMQQVMMTLEEPQPYPRSPLAPGPPSSADSSACNRDGGEHRPISHSPLQSQPLASYSLGAPVRASHLATPAQLTAHDNVMRHVTFLAQSPRITAGQLIVRNPVATRASNLEPLFLALFPEYAAGKDVAAREAVVDVLSCVPTCATPGACPATTASAIPAAAVPIPVPPASTSKLSQSSSGSSSPNLGPAMPLPHSSAAVAPSAPPLGIPNETSPVEPRPASALATWNLQPSSPLLREPPPTSTASPLTMTASLCTELGESPRTPVRQLVPIGKRLIRTVMASQGEVLRPSYWFEPDVHAAEHLRNVVNLMERSGGWRRPERKMRCLGGERKARGPDDIAP